MLWCINFANPYLYRGLSHVPSTHTRPRTPPPHLNGLIPHIRCVSPISAAKSSYLLDFWTYCCINCMHVLHDLAYLGNSLNNNMTPGNHKGLPLPATIVGAILYGCPIGGILIFWSYLRTKISRWFNGNWCAFPQVSQ